jgi:hypothetical protein
MDGLLTGPALAVDRRRRHMLRKAGCQNRSPARRRLLAHLADAPDDDIVDPPRIDPVPCDQCLEDDGEQLHRMNPGESAALPASPHGRPDGVDDQRGSGHA